MDQDDTAPDLSLVETDALEREYLKRHDAAVIITHQQDGDANKFAMVTHGGLTLAMGLVARAMEELRLDHQAESDE